MDNQTVLKAVQEQLQPILAKSSQAIYVFLSESDKFCNGKFAEMLGYDSAEEWAGTNSSFTDLFVDDASQSTLVGAYRGAVNGANGSSVEVTWKKKSGGTVKTRVILVPVAYQGTLLALHYIDVL